MSLQIADNFSYKGKKPLDARLVCNDIPDILALPVSTIYDGIIVYSVVQKKFYTYDSSNTIDPTLQQWRELTTAGILIQSATIDSATTSATYNHLILTLSDGTTIDCGNAKGDKGDKGDGFAIIKLYTSVSDMTSDASPVNDGQMVAVIDSSTTPLTAKVYIRNSVQTQDASGNENGYTFFCNLADATVIQGPQGIQGQKGDKGDTPVITTQAIAATSTTPSGTKITFTTGTGSTAVSTSINVYNGKDGVSVSSATINASGELVFTLSDASTINVGKIGGNGTGGCITMLGCFDTAPTTFAQNDIYYNNLDGLIYKSPDGTTWGTGTQPEKDILYISMDDHKIYSYTNNTFEVYGGTGASVKLNNALRQETDGLYVEDLSNKVNALNIAQKTVNSSLDYCQLGFDNSSVTLGTSRTITLAQSATIPFDYHICGNMQYNLSDHTIHLTANKTYEIYYQTKQISTVKHMERLYNTTTGEWLDPIVNCDTEDESHSFNYIYTPTVDSDISIRNCWTYNASSFNIRVNCTNKACPGLQNPDIECMFSVKEIGREILIDPVEYVDSTKGIEDTPVGELITKLGTITPAHYLPCDGTIYNIVDYPELAQKLKDEYGKVNYFGGDGVDTFAVPNYSSSNWWTPGLVNGLVPSPYAVTVSSVYNSTQYQKELLFDGIISKDSCWHSAADGSDTDIWVKFDFGKDTYIQGLRMAVRSTSYLGQLPSTFVIEGSYDDITYITIKSYSGLPNPTSTDFREHIFDKPVNYRYYRLNHMTSNMKNNGHDYCSIAELEFAKIETMSYIKYEPTYYMELNQDAYINQYCDTYSTDEKIIGKWTNGKPLYRKVVTGTITANNSSLFTVNENVDCMISIKGYTCPDGIYYFSFNFTQNGNTQRCVFYKKDVDSIEFRGNGFTPGEIYAIILEYTKTTDAENSFDYGMIIDQFAQEALLDVAVTDAEVDKCFE